MTFAFNKSKKTNEDTPLKGCSIILLDKNHSAQKHMKDELTFLGASSIDYSNGKESLQKIAEKGYHIVFLDSQLDEKRSLNTLLEEIRAVKKHWRTILVLTTSDKTRGALIESAQYEPDEYMLRPFSTEEMSKRISAARAKKRIFEAVDKALYEEKYFDCISGCDEIISDHPEMKVEAMKKKVMAMTQDPEQRPKAERLLRDVLGSDENTPWFVCQLAILLKEDAQFDEAEDLLRKTLESKPDYLVAADILADILVSQKRYEDALDILDSLGAHAYSNSSRIRLMAALSFLTGQGTAHKSHLSKLIEKTAHSDIFNPMDVHHLSSLYIQENKESEAEACLSALKGLPDPSEHEFASIMNSVEMDFQKDAKEKATEKLFTLIRKMDGKTSKISHGGLLRFSMLCMKINKPNKALPILESIKDNIKDPSERLFFDIAFEQAQEDFEKMKEEDSSNDSRVSKPIATGHSAPRGDLAKRLQGAMND